MNRLIERLGTGAHALEISFPAELGGRAAFALLGPQTVLTVEASRKFGPGDALEVDHILGNMPDGTCVSFLDCVLTGQTFLHAADGSRSCRTTYFPNFVVFGRSHLLATTPVSRVAASVGDAHDIFYDFDAFGTAPDPGSLIGRILDRVESVSGRRPREGADPVVGYFSGDCLITSGTSGLGDFSASHWVRQTSGGPRRFSAESDIVAELSLARTAPYLRAFEAATVMLRFLELVAGRTQDVRNLMAMPSDSDPDRWLDVYWSMRPPSGDRAASLSPADLPLNGGIDRNVFGKVWGRWMDADDRRAYARCRYADCLKKGIRFDHDRLVAAANMFDLLPPEALPESVKLSDDLAEAVAAARGSLNALPASEERDSILGSLGRASQVTLKKKVRHRAAIVRAAIPSRLDSLELVLDKAVDCRNHLVHGTPTKVSFDGFLPFLTRALEFTFGASELLEAGWDAAKWQGSGWALTHPWGEFVAGFGEDCSRLRRAFP